MSIGKHNFIKVNPLTIIMLGNALKTLVLLSLFTVVVSASIHMTFPKEVTYSDVAKVSSTHGEPNYLKDANLGSIAPGQTLDIVIDRSTGTAFFWDNLQIAVPDGWQHTGAKHPDYFNWQLIVPKDAALGMYNLTMYASGDIQVVTPEIIRLALDVRNDVYSFKVDSSYPVYIDSSNSVPFTVKSDSVAADVVRLSLDGVPSTWYGSKSVILSPNEGRRMFFLVEPKTEGSYDIAFKVSSSLGGAGGSADSKMVVYPASLKAKLTVLNEGFSIVTVVLQPIYSILSIIGSLF